MSRYLISIIQPDGEPPPPEVLGKVMRDVDALIDASRSAGVWVFNGGLHPPAEAVVVRPAGEELLVTDGPYVEAREHLGGFLVVEVPDFATALEWARRTARAIPLPIELRQFRGTGEN